MSKLRTGRRGTDDDCDVEGSGSGYEDYWGDTREPSVAKETNFVNSRDNKIKEPEIDINESMKTAGCRKR